VVGEIGVGAGVGGGVLVNDGVGELEPGIGVGVIGGIGVL